MPDFITLSCPSCGGKLQITNDIDRFACAHCGTEHIVKRGGGLVSLAPVVEGIQQVRMGVDKTASELAIRRLTDEIAELEVKKKKDTPTETAAVGCLLAAGICVGGMCMVSEMSGGSEAGMVFLIPPAIAAIVLLISFVVWNKEVNEHVAPVEREIARKREELAKHKELVSTE